MSTASPGRPGERGLSALEVVIVLGMVALISLVLEGTISGTRNAERYLSAVRRVTERGQRVAYELRELVTASRRLFVNDAVGQGYLEALVLDRLPRVGTARLPLADELGILQPDPAGDPHTGNLLLFLEEDDALAVLVDPLGQVTRYVDTYRFVCVYPHATDRYVVNGPGATPAVDLVVWRSGRFPSYSQITGIENAVERRTAVIDLVQRHGLEVALDPDGTVDTAFYDMDPLGTLSATPVPDPQVPEDPAAAAGGRLVYANLRLAPTADDAHRRALFTRDDPAEWTPGGFEVKVVGPSGARQVWMHVVVEAQATRGELAVLPCTVIASIRDL